MSERRYDPTVGEWRAITNATATANRPDSERADVPAPCALCQIFDPGSEVDVPRKGYRFAVVADVIDPPSAKVPATALQPVAPALGVSETVVYTDRHEESLSSLDVPHLARLVDVWADRYASIGAREDVAYVFMFEQRSSSTGPPGAPAHPHGRIHAYRDIPPVPMRELRTAAEHRARAGTCVYCDIVAQETASGLRVVAQNQQFVAYVPFAARFPYEVHLASKRHATSLLDLTDPERYDLADLLRTVLIAYDGLFDAPPSYIMSMHQAPTGDGQWLPVSHFHIELTAPHQSSTWMGNLAGEELGAGVFVNDSPPEVSAAQLRAAVAPP
ncbi:MAG TPA: galactose-1-phosphate uridylyltransferase [Micromonosporaceae bacterium]|nr:galactose-1-phosphate uridylyltransferase [Micromonosporaceae bacterium]